MRFEVFLSTFVTFQILSKVHVTYKFAKNLCKKQDQDSILALHFKVFSVPIALCISKKQIH